MGKRGIGAYTEVGDDGASFGLRMINTDKFVLNVEISPEGVVEVYVFDRNKGEVITKWNGEIDDLPFVEMEKFFRPDMFPDETTTEGLTNDRL